MVDMVWKNFAPIDQRKQLHHDWQGACRISRAVLAEVHQSVSES